jgi:hypothetical protein
MVFESTVWRISPLSAPRILRHCPHCAQERRFASTERFRLNAQKRRIDVWLIYACTECDATWNLTVLSRVAQSGIDRDLFERMTRNDPGTARALAFDRAALTRAGARVEPSVEYRVERSAGDVARARAACVPLRIHIAMTEPCRIRVDRLLSSELGLSRSCLERHAERGEIAIAPGRSDPLRRTVCGGMLIELAAPVLQT